MNSAVIFEIIGYAASLFVALSLIMVSIVKLRILNLVGSLFFVAYGLLIGSLPIVITNSFISIINIYHLSKAFLPSLKEFSYLKIGELRRQKLLDFVEAQEKDIRRHFPHFRLAQLEEGFGSEAWMFLALKRFQTVGFAFLQRASRVDLLTREERPAFDYIRDQLLPEAILYLHIDYVAPEYRDIGLSNLFYRRLAAEIGQDIRFVAALSPSSHAKNRRYLKRNGYRSEGVFGDYELFLRPINQL